MTNTQNNVQPVNLIYRRLSPPHIVEERIVDVNPERLATFLECDYKLWTLPESGNPPFAGKEVWVSIRNPGEIRIVMYWEHEEGWKAVSQDFLEQQSREMDRHMGEGNVRIRQCLHDPDPKTKLCEAMPVLPSDAWTFRQFHPPHAVEELLIQVVPEKLETFLAADHAIWTQTLAAQPGFLGKEVLQSVNNPGLLTCLVYWETTEQWQSIPEQVLIAADEELVRILGPDVSQVVGSHHESDPKGRLSAFRR